MTTVEKEALHTVYSTYRRYARLMCADADADADVDEIQDAVDDACEAAHACANLPWKVIETIQHMANETAVLEQSDQEEASELEDTHFTYIESL